MRSRVSSYFHEGRWEDAKTGTLVREAADVDYIVVANEKEALALENHLIKQKKPRFNILLRDDKTYPYIKLTLGERYPRVYVTRRLRRDGSRYYGPYFPTRLAYKTVDLIHRHPVQIDRVNRGHVAPSFARKSRRFERDTRLAAVTLAMETPISSCRGGLKTFDGPIAVHVNVLPSDRERVDDDAHGK